jgi:hypothetical protein
VIVAVGLLAALSFLPNAGAASPQPRWPICERWREVPVPGDELYPVGTATFAT